MPARAEETRSGPPGKCGALFWGRGDAAERESRAASGAARDLERAATRSRRPGRSCTASRRRSCDWRERAKRPEECRHGRRRPDRGPRESAEHFSGEEETQRKERAAPQAARRGIWSVRRRGRGGPGGAVPGAGGGAAIGAGGEGLERGAAGASPRPTERIVGKGRSRAEADRLGPSGKRAARQGCRALRGAGGGASGMPHPEGGTGGGASGMPRPTGDGSRRVRDAAPCGGLESAHQGCRALRGRESARQGCRALRGAGGGASGDRAQSRMRGAMG